MKLRKVKTITYIMIASICALLFAMGITRVTTLGYIASVAIIAVAVFELKFWRCPYCYKFLGRLDDKGKYCCNCGKKIIM